MTARAAASKEPVMRGRATLKFSSETTMSVLSK
jgi:hypothetical protein